MQYTFEEPLAQPEKKKEKIERYEPKFIKVPVLDVLSTYHCQLNYDFQQKFGFFCEQLKQF